MLQNLETTFLDSLKINQNPSIKKIVNNPTFQLKKKAELFFKKKDFKNALIYFSEVLKNENDFYSVSNVAHCHYHLENNDRALEFYFQALMIASDNPNQIFEIYKNIGNIYAKSRDFDGAREYFNKAYATNRDSDAILVNLATMEIQNNEYGNALYFLRKALDINNKNDNAWTGLALVHHKLGDVELSMANIKFAIEINIENKLAVHLYTQWCLQENKIQEAVSVLTEHISNIEFNIDTSYSLVNLFLIQKEYKLALFEMERILTWEPDNVQALDVYNQIRNQIDGN